MKAGLDNIARSALNELSLGLIEMFSASMQELIQNSRQQRQMGFMLQNQKMVYHPGAEKEINF